MCSERLWNNSPMGRLGCGCPILVVLLLICLMCSCATKTKIEYRDRDVNHYITKTVHDTLRIMETDSVHHEIKVVNDTVYDTKYVEKTRWRDRIVEKYDTCWRDSVVFEQNEIVREVIKIPKWCYYSLAVCGLFVIFAIVKLYRWIQWH